jgi:hypothetical protein
MWPCALPTSHVLHLLKRCSRAGSNCRLTIQNQPPPIRSQRYVYGSMMIHDMFMYGYFLYMDCTDHWCKNLVGTSPTSAGVSSTISDTNATLSKSWVPERWETVEALLWESSNPNRYFRIYIYIYYLLLYI